jgi:hypothetical protein
MGRTSVRQGAEATNDDKKDSCAGDRRGEPAKHVPQNE